MFAEGPLCEGRGLLLGLQPCMRTGSTLLDRTAEEKDDTYEQGCGVGKASLSLTKADAAGKACYIVI